MLVKSDSEKEKKIVEDIITNDEQLKQQHELFVAEMAFKQEMINARKTLSLTQKDVSRLSGLSQQAVSRIENGASGTISTVRVEFYSNTIWEDVCKKVFDDDLDKEIPKEQKDKISDYYKKKELPYPEHIDKAKLYKQIVEKPLWIKSSNDQYDSESTLKLDCIKFDIENSRMDIYDAKYYVLQIPDDETTKDASKVSDVKNEKAAKESKRKTIKDAPKVSDVTKQYLYQLAYKRFADALGIKNISNSFLMPSDEDTSSNWGTVSMSMFEMFDEFGLQKINVVYLCAEKLYDSYLDDKKNGIDIMNNHRDAIAD